jgi:hypothetical protein
VAALALASSFPFNGVTTTPAFAQSLSDDDGAGDISGSEVRDFLMDQLRARRDRRALLRDFLAERRDTRDELMDLIGDRGDRREQLLDLITARRDRRNDLMDLMEDRGDRREHLLDLISARHDRRDDLMDLIGDRGDLRQRLLQRLAAGDEGNCFFVSRSVRAEDGEWLAFVRRRVCRD